MLLFSITTYEFLLLLGYCKSRDFIIKCHSVAVLQWKSTTLQFCYQHGTLMFCNIPSKDGSTCTIYCSAVLCCIVTDCVVFECCKLIQVLQAIELSLNKLWVNLAQLLQSILRLDSGAVCLCFLQNFWIRSVCQFFHGATNASSRRWGLVLWAIPVLMDN